MKDSPNKKVVFIAVLATALCIAASIIRSVSEERRGRRNEVLAEIGSTLVSDQKIQTPILILPTQESYRGEKGKVFYATEKTRQLEPVRADLEGDVTVEQRSRGIYHAQAYSAEIRGKVRFELPPIGELLPEPDYPDGKVTAGKPYLKLPLDQKKGLLKFPTLRIAGFDRIKKPYNCKDGICFDVDATYEELRAAMKDLELGLELRGMDQLAFETFVPEATLKLRSNWSSPSFRGAHLPARREISDAGFTADWKVVNMGVLDNNAFSVRFVDPVDVYTLTDRATKYAILFIVSVFAAFFLVEAISKLRLHPLQYGLVGAALTVFYLLVTSLAEHIPFGAAYLASAVASTGLIWFYLRAVMKQGNHSAFMGASISGLYGMLFVIISAEDYSLLFGSLLIFALLAAIMIATRKLDWYALETPLNAQ